MEKITKSFYKKNLGTLSTEYPSFEHVYDLKNNKELTTCFVQAIRHTDKNMLESMMLQNASTLDQNNNEIDVNIKLDIPIYQIIGSKDEIWQTDISEYKNRFPNIKTCIIEGEKHKGVILNAKPFYEGLKNMYFKDRDHK